MVKYSMPPEGDKRMSEKKCINDALKHLNNMEGFPPEANMEMKKMPKPLRYFGYFLLGSFQ